VEGVHYGTTKILTFKGPAAYWIGVNKIPPKFDTLFVTSL